MEEDPLVQRAVQVTWAIYVTMHPEVDTADDRQCSLTRYLQSRLQAGENNVEELVCSGLAHLDRVPVDSW
jgi:hypothetical protein